MGKKNEVIIDFSDRAWGQYKNLSRKNKEMLKRINDLIEDILENNEKFESGEFYIERGKGSPKQLKYKFASCWSRRIDKKNRLVYRVCNKKLEIIECKTYYGNK